MSGISSSYGNSQADGHGWQGGVGWAVAGPVPDFGWPFEMFAVPESAVRRLYRPVPAVAEIVAGDQPVLAFGNQLLADVATLGINPSVGEFCSRDGQPLLGAEARLIHTADRDVGQGSVSGRIRQRSGSVSPISGATPTGGSTCCRRWR